MEKPKYDVMDSCDDDNNNGRCRGAGDDGGDTDSTFKILVATDNHIGYNEKDPIRGQDSLDTFEEILKYARDLEVDMILLGGDLFHENKPSRKTLHSAMELFRHYCMGERECSIELLSDPSTNFHSRFANVNYLDPNYNVSIPVFAIHGNHDDPAGDGSLSALDILSTAGLINYFGRQREVDDITISPIILRKGESHLALYGLGNIRDERLFRTFSSHKVKMMRPAAAQESDPDNWFNLMLFHQNRAAHSPKNYIPEVFLDDFLDLIVWGHEHDCHIDPLYIPQRDFYISQPGSSCITSLSEGEALKKHVALLTIRGNQFELCPLPLKSIRPFVFSDLILQQCEGLDLKDAKAVNAVIANRVDHMIKKAVCGWIGENAGKSEKQCPLPLIRLRVDYTGTTVTSINPQRFGQAFAERVANPRDIVHLVRKRPTSSAASKALATLSINLPTAVAAERSAARMEDLVTEYLGMQRLDLLPQNEFSDVVKIFVEKDDKDAIENFLKSSLSRTIGGLRERQQLQSLKEEIERIRIGREEEWRRLNPTGGEALISHRSHSSSNDSQISSNHGNEKIDSEGEQPENTLNASSSVSPSSARAAKSRSMNSTAAASKQLSTGPRQKRPTPLQLSAVNPEVATNTSPATSVVVQETPPLAKRSRCPPRK